MGAPAGLSQSVSKTEKMKPERMIDKNGREEADAYYGNNDEWDEEFPHDDVDLEEQFGSLETAEAFCHDRN